jgi:hypothetical protein
MGTHGIASCMEIAMLSTHVVVYAIPVRLRTDQSCFAEEVVIKINDKLSFDLNVRGMWMQLILT